MEYEKLVKEVESYINGNIANFRAFLKKCSKKDMVTIIEIFEETTDHDGIKTVKNLLD